MHAEGLVSLALDSERVANLASARQPAGNASNAPPSGRQNPQSHSSDAINYSLACSEPALAPQRLIAQAGKSTTRVISMPDLTVLGGFALMVNGEEHRTLPRKVQALLTYLALQPGRRFPREIIADMLWTRGSLNRARHSLRQSLVVLRRSSAHSFIRTDAETIWIEQGSVWIDALAVAAARADGSVTALSYAASLYRGPLLDRFPPVSAEFDDWLQIERARAAGIAAEILRGLAQAQIGSGDFSAGAATAANLIGLDPLDESAHRLRMTCLARAGRRAEALVHYDACVRTLHAELDIAPDPETVSLAGQIRAGSLNQGPYLAPPDVPPARDAASSFQSETVRPAGGGESTPADADPTARTADADPTAPACGTEPTAIDPAITAPAMQHGRRVAYRFAWLLGMAVIAGLVAASLMAAGLMLRSIPLPPAGVAIATIRTVGGFPAPAPARAGIADRARHTVRRETASG
jgi:DNA-binding SARP family transcriptional activator